MYARVYNKRDYRKSVQGTIVKGQYEICIGDCYNVKDLLKELGYKWNDPAHLWCLTCKVEEIGNAIADVVVKINLPMREYKDMLYSLTHIDADMSKITMDDAHAVMLKNHYTGK